jgi:TRAP-type C4-dicarboxylate transport system permease small subunit
MKRLARFYDRAAEACGRAAALVILALTSMITLDVLLRNLAGTTIPGDNEMSEYAMLLITALAAPWLLKRGQHVRIDIVLKAWPPLLGWLCEIASDLIGLGLSLLMAVYGVRVALASAALGTMTVKDFRIPEWCVLAPLPLMFALLALGFVLRLEAMLAGPRRARREGMPG